VKILKSALLLVSLVIPFTACQNALESAQLHVEGKTYQGQLRYAGNGNPIIGEVIVRAASMDHFQIEFSSGPGFPLMRARIEGDRATAEGVIARGRWKGAKEKAPAQIAGWFILPEVFSKAAGGSAVLRGESWSARSTHSGGRLTRLEIRVQGSGERFSFHFAG
jgi:hypothetical protein